MQITFLSITVASPSICKSLAASSHNPNIPFAITRALYPLPNSSLICHNIEYIRTDLKCPIQFLISPYHNRCTFNTVSASRIATFGFFNLTNILAEKRNFFDDTKSASIQHHRFWIQYHRFCQETCSFIKIS